ncbi:hypothetical protein XELAEV_18006145mg [Xenopus laevis]|uniref:Uncharacterized protein n=1 Tax=Xenopus laevis TaxID=8355 RepID=A0A974I3V0_XENLA|nr:hypothetical protein XELAEV_18006145mg [Xenopus laevis]
MKCKLLSENVNGFNELVKQYQILNHCNSLGENIIFCQETHFMKAKAPRMIYGSNKGKLKTLDMFHYRDPEWGHQQEPPSWELAQEREPAGLRAQEREPAAGTGAGTGCGNRLRAQEREPAAGTGAGTGWAAITGRETAAPGFKFTLGSACGGSPGKKPQILEAGKVKYTGFNGTEAKQEQMIKPHVRWETHKCIIRGLLISVGSYSKTEKQKKVITIVREIRRIDQTHKRTDAALNQLLAKRRALKAILDVNSYKPFFRSKQEIYEYRNKCGKLLANRLRMQYKKAYMYKMKDVNKTVVYTTKDIARCF